MGKHAKTSRKYRKPVQPYEPPVRAAVEENAEAEEGLASDDAEDIVSVGAPKKDRGVIYIGHIPHGFYEDQMRSYFSQFGTVLHLRMARNKKMVADPLQTGKPKHYAFLEFEEGFVADVVAEAMNNYLMFGKILKCKRLKQSEIHPMLFRGGNRIHNRQHGLDRHRQHANKPVDPVRYQKLVQRKLAKDEEKRRKLREQGIEYEFPGIESIAMPTPTHTKFLYSDEEEEDVVEEQADSEEEQFTVFAGDSNAKMGSGMEWDAEEDDDDDDEEEDDDDEEEDESSSEGGGSEFEEIAEIEWGNSRGDGEEESEDSDVYDSEEDGQSATDEQFLDFAAGSSSEDGSDDDADDSDSFEVPWSKGKKKAPAKKKKTFQKTVQSARKPKKAQKTPQKKAAPRRAVSEDVGKREKRVKGYKKQAEPTPLGRRRR